MIESEGAHVELVRRAQAGEKESVAALAELAREKVYSYINRVTLDEDRSQDLAQETLLAILKSLETLERPDRFWPWVFRIATNKTRQYFRAESRRRALQMSAIEDAHLHVSLESQGGEVTSLAREELAQITHAAMAQINERHRMVLALRFFEDMPHGHIARVLGCSELGARTTFFRAKHALMRELRRRGLHKGVFVAALGAFGQATVSSEASAALVTVSASATSETLLGGLLSIKAKGAAAAAAIVLTTALALMWQAGRLGDSPSAKRDVRFVHFVHQSMLSSSGNADFGSSLSKGAYEQWYYFPDGIDGPFLCRMQRWNPEQTAKLCWWVQNGQANYYVNSADNTVYVQNRNLYHGNYSTEILPFDSEQFCQFVRQVEGDESNAMTDGPGVSYERDPETGFAVARVDTRFEDIGPFKTTYDYAELEMSLFDAPAGMRVVDERDEMHKRGWTYFRVAGRLGDNTVSGMGQVPFVHGASKRRSAWLKLSVNGKLAAVDNGAEACLVNSAGTVAKVYAGGSFFTGLARPWTGFHTLDTVRRDAAQERIWFSTAVVKPYEKVEVMIVGDRDGVQCAARYSVDMNNDLLEKIEFWMGKDGPFERAVGELVLSYLDELDEADGEFLMPERVAVPESRGYQKASILWPFQLLDAS